MHRDGGPPDYDGCRSTDVAGYAVLRKVPHVGANQSAGQFV